MLKLFLSSAAKFLFSYVFWVFLLSLRLEGQTLFDHSHRVLVDNIVVETAEEQIDILYQRIQEVAVKVYTQYREKNEDKYKL